MYTCKISKTKRKYICTSNYLYIIIRGRNKKLLVDIVNNLAIEAMTMEESAVVQMSLRDRRL
jgi:hypothetical protein